MSTAGKYRRVKRRCKVSGFIVNIYDATNFDIDLQLSTELRDRYNQVIHNEYWYKLVTMAPGEPQLSDPIKATTYRCRLRGVTMMKRKSSSSIAWEYGKLLGFISNMIDRTDGWIECIVSDIDVYKRILVEIIIHAGNKTVNLKDILLEHTDIFRPYIS